MPDFNLPFSRSSTAVLPVSAHPPSPPVSGPPSPEPPPASGSGGKGLRAGLRRLAGSFARSEAVHQSRLDAGWGSTEWHLLAYYSQSAR